MSSSFLAEPKSPEHQIHGYPRESKPGASKSNKSLQIFALSGRNLFDGPSP